MNPPGYNIRVAPPLNIHLPKNFPVTMFCDWATACHETFDHKKARQAEGLTGN